MFLYDFFVNIFFVILLPIYIVAGIFKPKLLAGFKEKLFLGGKPLENTILFHAISVGEVNAVSNLIKKVRETLPNVKIVVTTGTKTGQAAAKKNLGTVADLITYFPFDVPFCVNRFLKILNPKAVFIMETELWPNFITISAKKKIPLFLINARISDRTFKSYKKLSFIFKPLLCDFSGIWAQSEEDAEKFVSIGSNPLDTCVMGNLKFDIKKPICDIDLKQGKNRVVVAGSTHRGENEIILAAFKSLKEKFKDIKLLIAPRHPEIFDETFLLCKKTGLSCGKRSPGADFEQVDIIMLDTMGELSKSYGLAYFAFIGGSFNKTGGHNPLEATIFAKPTVTGASINNFKDIYAILSKHGAAKIVNNLSEFEKHAEKLLADKDFYNSSVAACCRVFEENSGALNFVLDKIKCL